MIVKYILKYRWRTKDYMLVYHCDELVSLEYIDSVFQSGRDSCKSTSEFVITLGSEAFCWKSLLKPQIVLYWHI